MHILTLCLSNPASAHACIIFSIGLCQAKISCRYQFHQQSHTRYSHMFDKLMLSLLLPCKRRLRLSIVYFHFPSLLWLMLSSVSQRASFLWLSSPNPVLFNSVFPFPRPFHYSHYFLNPACFSLLFSLFLWSRLFPLDTLSAPLESWSCCDKAKLSKPLLSCLDI